MRARSVVGWCVVLGWALVEAQNASACPVPGDYDDDDTVDLWDLAFFESCRTGPAGGAALTDACAVFDIDGDGDVDLLDWGSLQRRFGHAAFGNGPLFPSMGVDVAEDPYAIAIADFNGDGMNDMVTTRLAFAGDVSSYSVLLNRGNGRFLDAITHDLAGPAAPRNILTADFDGDGDIDFGILRHPGIFIHSNDGNGAFSPLTELPIGGVVNSACAEDLDSDGDVDIVAMNGSVFLNRGDGTFADPVSYGVGGAPEWNACGDFDGDEDTDLVFALPSEDAVSVLLNDGDGAFAMGGTYAAGERPQQVSVGDVDGDGDDDVAVELEFNAGGNLAILLNDGNGTLSEPSFYDGYGGVAHGFLADLDGDGDLDIAGVADSAMKLLFNQGNGVFGNAITYHPEVGVAEASAVGDLDGDGDVDFGLADSVRNRVLIVPGNGDGTFAAEPAVWTVELLPVQLAVGDLDGDALDDMAVYTEINGRLWLYRNNGDGTLSLVESGISPSVSSLVIADMDGDGQGDLLATSGSKVWIDPLGSAHSYEVGWYVDDLAVADVDGDEAPDVVVSQGNNDLVVLLTNAGDGTLLDDFQSIAVGDGPAGHAFADFDGDGDKDLATCMLVDDNVMLLLNDDGGLVAGPTYPTGERPSAIAAADLNCDGLADLAVANRRDGTVSVLLNTGDGRFAEQMAYAVGGVWPGGVPNRLELATADLNGDGDLDIAVSNHHLDNVFVLLNEGDGTFVSGGTYVSFAAPTGVGALDLDRDGDAELISTANVGIIALENRTMP